MADTLALIPYDRQERKGVAGFTEYILSDDVTAILKANNAVFLPASSSKAEEITPEVAEILIGEVVDSDRVEMRHGSRTGYWRLQAHSAVNFTVRIWDYPRFIGISSREEVLALALEHDQIIVPKDSASVIPADNGKIEILEDAYLLKALIQGYALVEYDPVKAVRLLIQRLNRESKPRRKPPPKRLAKDDYHAIVDCLRETIYAHPAIQAGMYGVVNRCWGLPRERQYFVKTLLTTLKMAEVLFGRRKPWRKRMKFILTKRKNLILRSLANGKIESHEREGIEWLFGEMKALRIPGVKAWLKRSGYQSGNSAAA